MGTGVQFLSFFPVLFCGLGILALATSIFWLWMIIDCASNEPSGTNDKIVWLLVIIFIHFIGALLYYFIRRPERIRLIRR